MDKCYNGTSYNFHIQLLPRSLRYPTLSSSRSTDVLVLQFLHVCKD
jgi:hypothetical protein